jgi:signal transduction histidine kinase
VTGVLSTARDITERKRLEMERTEIEGQMRQQQKLESIGTLASGIAHEINNPITGIMNYAQLIADKAAPDSPELKYGHEIIHETERVATIVKNLLQFARHEKASHSPARMQDIVEQTLSLIQAVIRRDQITIRMDMPADLPALKCRSQQIQQVLMNLLTNARDALNEKYPGYDERKIIQVTSRLFEKEGRRWVRLTVEDHGNGIAEAIRPRIFDPFFTTKPRDKGTGLGLSISHGIAKEHHGELHFETEAGRFTRFHLDLPVDNGWGLENSKTSAARASEDPRRTS